MTVPLYGKTNTGEKREKLQAYLESFGWWALDAD